MATSKIQCKDRYVDIDISTGDSLFNGILYYGQDNTYTSYTAKYAEIINSQDNAGAIVNLLGWTTRVYTFVPNKTVKVRFYL